MKEKKAFTLTIEMVLVILACTAAAFVCLAAFSDNIANIFADERNYKTIFQRDLE